MSDAKKAAKPAKAKEEKTTTAEETGPGANKVKKGSQWTFEKIAKFARRFSSEAEWQSSHPSSYKSTVAHGWMNDAKKLFRPTERKHVSHKRSA